MFVAIIGAFVCIGVNSQKVSALSGCTYYGTRNVTVTNNYNGAEYNMGTYPYYETLRRTSKDPCVASLQQMANVFCTPDTRLVVDSDFGYLTYRAIKSIQYSFATDPYSRIKVNGSNIIVDGIAGPQTWSILQALRSWGSPSGGSINCKLMW